MKYVTPVIWGVIRWAVGSFFGWLAMWVSFAVLMFSLHISLPMLVYGVIGISVMTGAAYLVARLLDFKSTVSTRVDKIVAAIMFVCAFIFFMMMYLNLVTVR